MPSLVNLKLTPFTVAGRINSGAFQKAKTIAGACDAAASATIIEVLPTEYAKLLVKLSQEYGGPAYLHESGVAVFSEQAGFIGDDAAFIKWLDKNGIGGYQSAIASKGGRGVQWDQMAEKAFQTLLCESEERTFAFIALATEGEGELGRLVFELFPSLAPKTVDNFFALCAKESGGYVGSAIHRIKPGGWFQGGDVVTGGGNGGAAASGSGLPDESFHIKHSEYGILGMANNGKPHSATSQFYVTFAPTPSFDGHYGAFGKLVDGHKLLAFLEDFDTKNERPRANLMISAAGKVLPFTAERASEFYADEDEAASKLQAMHKARKQRQENEERKKAAARVQAAKRGQKARQEAKEQKEAAVKMQAIQRGRKSRSK